MERLYTLGSAALTTQILAEFFTIVTRKLSNPLTIEESTRQVELLARVWPVFDVTAFTVIEAIRGVQSHQMPYWDSQIWASAPLNQIPIILSEDFSAGRVIEGVRFINPFIQEIE
ncbi:MAG: PIN domain-containing protein [bacterium]